MATGFFVICAFVVVGAFAQQVLFPEEMEECRAKFNIDEAVIKNHQPIPEDKKCYHRCVAEKLGVMNENGDIDVAALKEKYKNVAPDLIPKVDKCANIKMADPCDTARAVCKCIHSA